MRTVIISILSLMSVSLNKNEDLESISNCNSLTDVNGTVCVFLLKHLI